MFGGLVGNDQWMTSRLQVIEWRKLFGLPMDMATVHMDSWGIRKLFSHLLRRWLGGADKPKETWVWIGKLFLCNSPQ